MYYFQKFSLFIRDKKKSVSKKNRFKLSQRTTILKDSFTLSSNLGKKTASPILDCLNTDQLLSQQSKKWASNTPTNKSQKAIS